MITAAFTGTRHGMTRPQREIVALLLRGVTELHHGDCIGADAEADALADEVRCRKVIHPPSNPARRAYCKPRPFKGKVRAELPYLERNRAMVDEVLTHGAAAAYLIACPQQPLEVQRSGTWATIRYAREVGLPVVLIRPDGWLQREAAVTDADRQTLYDALVVTPGVRMIVRRDQAGGLQDWSVDLAPPVHNSAARKVIDRLARPDPMWVSSDGILSFRW